MLTEDAVKTIMIDRDWCSFHVNGILNGIRYNISYFHMVHLIKNGKSVKRIAFAVYGLCTAETDTKLVNLDEVEIGLEALDAALTDGAETDAAIEAANEKLKSAGYPNRGRPKGMRRM